MSLPHIILGFLAQPASGYDLKKIFDESVRNFWNAKLSQVYPTLHQLQRHGLVVSQRQASAKGPDRRVYRRTKAGSGELLRWLDVDPVMGTDRFPYLAQLFFMGQAKNLKHSQAFLSKLKDHFERRYAALTAVERYYHVEQIEHPETIDAESLHYYMTLRFGILRIAATIKWCDESLDRVKEQLRQVGESKSVKLGRTVK